MGQLLGVHKAEEGGVTLDRVDRAEDGIDGLCVLEILLELDEETVNDLEALFGLVDEALQQFRIDLNLCIVTHGGPPWCWDSWLEVFSASVASVLGGSRSDSSCHSTLDATKPSFSSSLRSLRFSKGFTI